jgi:hypothetical protein
MIISKVDRRDHYSGALPLMGQWRRRLSLQQLGIRLGQGLHLL